MQSGPAALLGFKLRSNFSIPNLLIFIGLMVGNLSFSLKSALIFGVGSENTESKCLWIKLAFFTGSLVRVLFLSLRSGMPTFSCLRVFM